MINKIITKIPLNKAERKITMREQQTLKNSLKDHKNNQVFNM